MHSHHRSSHKNGFSLVELSIVLVILGLLTGGILGGQSLIHAAELRAVGTEYDKWLTGVNTFRQKYFAFPGDMRNAQQFWDTATWNGDGNGVVAIEDQPGMDAQLQEHFLFWQHLSLAGLIEGEYTGVTGGGSLNHHVLGENAPASRYGNGGWTAETLYGGIASVRYDLDYINAFLLGAQTATETTHGALFNPQDVWNIDTKLDDGKPGQGRALVVLDLGACTTSSSMTAFDSDYALGNDAVACALYFRNAF